MDERTKSTRDGRSAEGQGGFGSTAEQHSPDDFDASAASITNLPDRVPAGESPSFGSTARDESPDDPER